MFSGLTKLRKLCNHPDLVTKEYSQDRQTGGNGEEEEEEEDGPTLLLDAPPIKRKKGQYTRSMGGLNNWSTTLYPFNCQFVVKRRQIKNHSNLGILGGDGSYIIHQMHTIDCSWSREKCGKGCVCARDKKDFFFFFF